MSNPTRLKMTPLTRCLEMRHRKNPKRHSIEDIIDSIKRNGFKATPMIDTATETMVAGHGRCLALERMKLAGEVVPDGIGIDKQGDWTVPVLYSAFKSESDRDAYVVADNRLSELGGYDQQDLADMLSAIAKSDAGLGGTGFDGDDLDELLDQLAAPDDEPESPGKDVNVEGHTRTIGAHQVRPPIQMTNADWKLELGDCLEGLRRLADNSVDAVVTDPPAGISFMGRAWDDDKGGRDKWIEWLRTVMVECLRVLKPGGHVVAWALPRTSHWTAMAVETAGFELRDVVYHIFGSGFPKSLDVVKAIDAKLGAEREVIGTRADGVGNTDDSIHKQEGFAASREKTFAVTAPATEEAARWDGWGTALKPAVEPWIVGRKPLDGTVAENVLKWSVGAVNVDAARVGAVNVDAARVGAEQMPKQRSVGARLETDQESWGAQFNTEREVVGMKTGRWPAHLVLSHSSACVPIGELEDERVINIGDRIGDGSRSLEFGMGKMATTTTTTTTTKYRCVLGCPVRTIDQQSGSPEDELGASRFFYVAKPSRAETEAGLGNLAIQPPGELTGGRAEGSAGLDSPRAGAGRTSGRANIHPTKKPIALMRWLVRLVTPPGGLVVDAFTGSGTTGMAALVEGCRFHGFELSPEYHRIASERLRSIIEDPRLADEAPDAELEPAPDPEAP